jgi:hypothetical protein
LEHKSIIIIILAIALLANSNLYSQQSETTTPQNEQRSTLQLQETLNACGNQNCESGAGENSENCAIDCGSKSGNTSFSEMLRFFEVGDTAFIPGVEFSIGDSRSNLPYFHYISITNIHPHASPNKESIFDVDEQERINVVALNQTDIDALFEKWDTEKDGRIRKDIIQRADINKMCQEKFGEGGCSYGVQTNEDWNTIWKDNKVNTEPLTDSPDEDYQNGKTIVYPWGYGCNEKPACTYYDPAGTERRWFFNFSNPVAREYAVEYVLMREDRYGKDNVFLDNWIPSDYWVDKDYAGPYISPGTVDDWRNTLADNLIQIAKEIKAAKPNTSLILNGFRTTTDNDQAGEITRTAFLDRLTGSTENLNSFDMIMFENGFWNQDANVEAYYRQSKRLGDNNKKQLYVASTIPEYNPDANNPLAYQVWLFVHLVGNQNTYIYINPGEYDKPMVNYFTYGYKLGLPLEEPRKEGSTWYRKYERGTIVFDTSIVGAINEKLGAIKFLEEICDSKDNDLDGLTNEDNVCCGNRQCDAGETVETCPTDCTQQCIREPELLGFIGQWKRGEITMLVLMQKMRQWKAGTGCPPE